MINKETVTEVNEWYRGLKDTIVFTDEIIRATIMANIPEIKEIIDIRRKDKRNKWERGPESIYIRVLLKDGNISATHIFQTVNDMLRLLRRWDGSWGRITTSEDKKTKIWPGYDMKPITDVIQESLFKI